MTVKSIVQYRHQELADSFYWKHGPCCSGCDWWLHVNSVAGECTMAAPVAGHERYEMLGMKFNSFCVGAGHPLTPRDHRCGEFKDSFDWKSLPPSYLKRIGYKGPVQ